MDRLMTGVVVDLPSLEQVALSAASADEAATIMSRLRRVGARLGGGAAGDIFEALLDTEEVAVKIVRGPVLGPDARKCKRLSWLREKRTVLVLSRHPHHNTVRYYAAFEAPCDGCDSKIELGDGVLVMERGKAIPVPMGLKEDLLGPIIMNGQQRIEAAMRAGRIGVQLVNALAHLHSVVKTIHRDIKPDNLLVLNDRICLSDFSAARTQMYDLQQAATTKQIGTMGYLAPEMYERNARYCSKVDVWSLGCTVLSYYNDSKPCLAEDYYALTLILQFHSRDVERVEEARSTLDSAIQLKLDQELAGEDQILVALRSFLLGCLRVDPAERPSAAALLRMNELAYLADATGIPLDDPPEVSDLLEDKVESSLIMADLMQELIRRFDFHQAGRLDAWQMDLLRDGLHRAFEEKDVRSVELLGCWLEFLRHCPQARLEVPDTSGRTLLHAVVQNHRSEALFDMLEDYCDDAFGGGLPRGFVDALDDDGRSALWLAAADGEAPLTCLRLLQLSANPNVTDAYGVSPLERCLKPPPGQLGQRDRVDVVKTLIAFGASVPSGLHDDARLTYAIRAALRLSASQAKTEVTRFEAELENARVLRQEVKVASISAGDGLVEQPPLTDLRKHSLVSDSANAEILCSALKLDDDLGSTLKLDNALDSTLKLDDALGSTLKLEGSSSTLKLDESPPTLEVCATTSIEARGALSEVPAEAATCANAKASLEPLPSLECIAVQHHQDALHLQSLAPPPPPKLEHSISAGSEAERALREFLVKASHDHAMTAFRVVDANGRKWARLEDLVQILDQVGTGLDREALSRRLRERWTSGHFGFREFQAWLRSPGHRSIEARRRTKPVSRQSPRPAVTKAEGRGASGQSRAGPSSASPSRLGRAAARREPAAALPSEPAARRRKSPVHTAFATERKAGLRSKEAPDARLRGALLRLFERLDTDGDGQLQPQEFARGKQLLVESSGYASGKVDHDRHGRVESEEWLACTMGAIVPSIPLTKLQIAQRVEAWLATEDAAALR